MKLESIIESGNLELYAIGALPTIEMQQVEAKLLAFPSLRLELLSIEQTLEEYAQLLKVKVNPFIKSFLSAKINYWDRLESKDVKCLAPVLSKNSKIEDFKLWLDDVDFKEPSIYKLMAGHILDASATRTIFIAWLNDGIPPEIHTEVKEKFLIVEGTCDVTIGENKYALVPGDFIEIPLHIEHYIQVTSDVRCKVILELTAA